MRAWELRYRAVSPRRLDNGRRIYSAHDVEKLQLLVAARQAGHSISQIASMENPALKELIGRYMENTKLRADLPDESIQETEDKRRTGFGTSPRRLFSQLDKFDFVSTYNELLGLRAKTDLDTFILEVLDTVFKQLDEGVSKHMICLAQEHALSAMIKSILLREFFHPRKIRLELRSKNEEPREKFRQLAFATLDGDLHEFGILMAAVLCANRGISSFYLGSSVPAEELINAARRLRIDTLILSIPKEPLIAAKAPGVFQDLLDNLPPHCRIVIGGKSESLGIPSDDRIQAFQTMKALGKFLENIKADPVVAY